MKPTGTHRTADVFEERRSQPAGGHIGQLIDRDTRNLINDITTHTRTRHQAGEFPDRALWPNNRTTNDIAHWARQVTNTTEPNPYGQRCMAALQRISRYEHGAWADLHTITRHLTTALAACARTSAPAPEVKDWMNLPIHTLMAIDNRNLVELVGDENTAWVTLGHAALTWPRRRGEPARPAQVTATEACAEVGIEPGRFERWELLLLAELVPHLPAQIPLLIEAVTALVPYRMAVAGGICDNPTHGAAAAIEALRHGGTPDEALRLFTAQ